MSMRPAFLILTLFSLSGCASMSGSRIVTPERVQATAAAYRAIAFGVSDFRQAEGLRAICVGTRRPAGELADLQELVVARMGGTAPVVVDARECELAGDTGWRVMASGMAAIQISAAVEWATDELADGQAGVVVNNAKRFTYELRMEREDGVWYTIDTYCFPQTASRICVSIDPLVTGTGGQEP